MTAKILIVDDMPANVKILEAKLKASFYHVLTAFDGATALEIAARERPDLVLLDVMMPGLDGYEVCRRLKATPDLSAIPVVMVTALDAPAERIRGLEAGADDFLTKPPNDAALFARVRSLVRVKMMFDELRMREETFRDLGVDDADPAAQGSFAGRSALIVEPKLSRAGAIADALRARLGLDSRICETGRETLAAISGAPAPDLFVISRRLGRANGLQLCSELRSRPETQMSAIILAVENGDFESVASALDLGASDYVMHPVDENELVARATTQLRRKNFADRLRRNVREGMRLAVTDGLTDLYNRRYADQHLARLVAQAHETGPTVSVVLLDIDRFKGINDLYGHAAGDRVLIELSNRLRQEFRSIDLVARYGGEEFLIVMPETNAEAASQAAERVRTAVEAAPFSLGAAGSIAVTVSLGVAEQGGRLEIAAALVDRADQALYASKRDGRNRVSVAAAAAQAAAVSAAQPAHVA